MVGEKAEADALRATSPEIAENVEEEVVPELLRAGPLFCFCYELRMLSCAARPHRTTKVRLRRGGQPFSCQLRFRSSITRWLRPKHCRNLCP